MKLYQEKKKRKSNFVSSISPKFLPNGPMGPWTYWCYNSYYILFNRTVHGFIKISNLIIACKSRSVNCYQLTSQILSKHYFLWLISQCVLPDPTWFPTSQLSVPCHQKIEKKIVLRKHIFAIQYLIKVYFTVYFSTSSLFQCIVYFIV